MGLVISGEGLLHSGDGLHTSGEAFPNSGDRQSPGPPKLCLRLAVVGRLLGRTGEDLGGSLSCSVEATAGPKGGAEAEVDSVLVEELWLAEPASELALVE